MTTKRRTLGITLCVLAALLIGGGLRYNRTSVSRADARQIVLKALSSADVNYTARARTVIEYCGKNIHTDAVIIHRGKDEKIESQERSRSIAWSMKTGDKAYTFLPRENKLLISESGKLLSDNKRSLLTLSNYEPIYEGTDKVAGRSVHVIDLLPLTQGRPSKRLWIDKKYGTVLKSIDYAANGEERGSTEISRINYGAKINDSAFALPPEKSVKRVMVCTSAASLDMYRSAGVPAKTPKYIPAGYKLEGYHLFNSQCPCDHRSAQITYTDGLNIISVFETPIMTSCGTNSGCKMSKCSGSGGCAVSGCEMAKTGSITRKDKTVVVVGDLLPDEVKKIAESVE